MKRLPILILLLAAVLIVVVQGEQSAMARTLPHESTSLLLRLTARADTETGTAPARDPFYGEVPREIAAIAPVTDFPPTPRKPAWPAFRIIGKQQDASGWSVFITLDGDTHAPVWVLREGESFYDQYQITTLQPPTLVIRRLGQATGKTFNIGKDES